MAKVEQRHRELAFACRWVPPARPGPATAAWILDGTGDPANESTLLNRIAQAVADAESRGAQSSPASSEGAHTATMSSPSDDNRADPRYPLSWKDGSVVWALALKMLSEDGNTRGIRPAEAHDLRRLGYVPASSPPSAEPSRDRAAECTCHSCEVLPQLHEQVAQMCEYLGSKRDEVPCDSWHLRDLIVKLRARVPSGDAGQGDLLTSDEIAHLDGYLIAGDGLRDDETYARFVCKRDMRKLLNAARSALRVPESTVPAQAAGGWIRCDDRLPDTEVTVLVWRRNQTEADVARLDGDGDWFEAWGHELRGITHWMPLPPPPATEKPFSPPPAAPKEGA